MYRTGNYSTTYLPHPTWVGRSVGRCGTRDRRLAGGERHAPTPSPGLTTALRRGKERAPRCAADLSPCRRRLDAPRVSPRTHARSRAPGAAGWVPGKWTGGGRSANRGNWQRALLSASPLHRFTASPLRRFPSRGGGPASVCPGASATRTCGRWSAGGLLRGLRWMLFAGLGAVRCRIWNPSAAHIQLRTGAEHSAATVCTPPLSRSVRAEQYGAAAATSCRVLQQQQPRM